MDSDNPGHSSRIHENPIALIVSPRLVTYTLNSFEFRFTNGRFRNNLGNFVRSKLKKTSLRRFIYDIFPTHIYHFIVHEEIPLHAKSRKASVVWPLASGSQLPVEFFRLAPRISISFKIEFFLFLNRQNAFSFFENNSDAAFDNFG